MSSDKYGAKIIKHKKISNFFSSIIFNLFKFLGRLKAPFIDDSVESLVRGFSRGGLGTIARSGFWSSQLGKMGTNVWIDSGVKIGPDPKRVWIGDNSHIDVNCCFEVGYSYLGERQGYIHIGSNVHIAPNVYIQGHGGVEIGNYAAITNGCIIYTSTDFAVTNIYKANQETGIKAILKGTSRASINERELKFAKVVIQDYAFVGIGTLILPGVVIGKGAIIGAGSVVTKNIPDWHIAMGVPAKVVKKREE